MKKDDSISFFIESATVDISKYNIKDIPGSSGRLDIISRCILSALLSKDSFEKNIQIWVFLVRYGTFLFNSEELEYKTFPKNEISLTDSFVKLIQKRNSKDKLEDNPLSQVKILEINIIEALTQFIELKYSVFVLSESGKNFLDHIDEIRSKKNKIFVIGNQSGEIVDSKELFAMNLPTFSLSNKSYLASSVIRLIKLHLSFL